MQKPNKIKKNLIKKNLKNKDFKFVIKNKMLSTNNYAKNVKNKCKKWIVLSEMQLKGRGRFNREFYSPKSSGIYLSLLYPLNVSTNYVNKITPLIGLCVAIAIEKLCNCSVEIKWVNDIILNNKKVGGILCESGIDSKNNLINYVIVGIGLNVYETKFSEDLKDIATTIEGELNLKIDRNLLVAKIINEIGDIKTRLESDFINDYKEKLNLINKEVIVSQNGEKFVGKAVDLSNNFELIVLKDNKEIKLSTADVSLKLI